MAFPPLISFAVVAAEIAGSEATDHTFKDTQLENKPSSRQRPSSARAITSPPAHDQIEVGASATKSKARPQSARAPSGSKAQHGDAAAKDKPAATSKSRPQSAGRPSTRPSTTASLASSDVRVAAAAQGKNSQNVGSQLPTSAKLIATHYN